eukprot:CAMPEP_0194743920 /NCGR_PEP_ID=MMETSP0296-20130528/100575_1 /TAXON_ID=39354 /ORGANISM="Heterosigma akashiwo, Strain CCMP2393" /LENGTH=449 /DNA_ID=CAMNT_0039655995 /DNA_START=201 /DNA_END=1550 /DNA_ORIENTATION=+
MQIAVSLLCLYCLFFSQFCNAFSGSPGKPSASRLISRTICRSSVVVDEGANPSLAKLKSKYRKRVLLNPYFDIDSYKEEERKTRRVVFDHKDWRRHRSARRRFRSVTSIFDSGTLRGLRNEVLVVTVSSILVCGWNTISSRAAAAGLLPRLLAGRALALGPAPFNYSSACLALLLTLRTNSSYARWAEARAIWERTYTRLMDFVRMALTYAQRPTGVSQAAFGAQKRAAALYAVAYVHAQKAHFREPTAAEEGALRAELSALLGVEEADRILRATHRPCAVIQDLSAIVRGLRLADMQRQALDAQVSAMCDTVGACERIFKTPLPLVYTRHTARFLMGWLLFLPLALAPAMGPAGSAAQWLTVPASAAVAFFLSGVEEIGVQLEEPFGVLPLEAYCADVRRAADQLVAFDPDCQAAAAADEAEAASAAPAGREAEEVAPAGQEEEEKDC